MGTSLAASLAVVILAAITGSNGYDSAAVGVREKLEINQNYADNDKKVHMLEMQISACNALRIQDIAKAQFLTQELDSAHHDVDELTQKEKLLNKTVEILSEENENLKVHLADKDAEVQSLSRQLNVTVQKLEAYQGTEIFLNTTVQTQNGKWQCTEAFSDTNTCLNNTLNNYYLDHDWRELRQNLERILDRKSEAYHQLQTTPYDHGYPLWKIGGSCQTTLAEVLMSGVQGPNISESDGDTILHGAAEGNCVNLINMMLDRGADIDERDNGGATPLVIASRYGQLAAVRLLEERGADVNAKDHSYDTGLHLAAQGGYLNVVKYLVEAGANVNARSKTGNTPIKRAMVRGRDAVVAYLSQFEQSLHTEEDPGSRKNTTEKSRILSKIDSYLFRQISQRSEHLP